MLEENRAAHDRYIVRMPPGWRDIIKARAVANRRSMNQEILIMLESVVGVAAGADLAGHAPAALKAHQNHSEASSHAAE